MNKKITLIFCIIIQSFTCFCQESITKERRFFNRDSILSFSLQRSDGSETLLKLSSKELLVIAFLSPECPLCKNYSKKLVSIRNKYLEKADFIGIIPGSFDAKEVVDFNKEYMPSWEIVKDSTLQLTRYLQGEVTPEVLVINSKNGGLIYKGAIDDWVVSLGKTKNRVTGHYLDLAINNFLNDMPSIPFITPVGCLINDF